MKLSQDEAICLILNFCQNKTVSSPTKLNKLLARLNLHFVPVDITFSLNKFGSYNADLHEAAENDFYRVEPYTLSSGQQSKKFILRPAGEELFHTAIQPKLNTIMTESDFQALQEEIKTLSSLPADEISGNEHKKLLLDVEDRFKLEQTLNETGCDMCDLYEELPKIEEDSVASISLKALIEYCYCLMKYLREVRFKTIPERYDYNAYMFDYYFLHNIKEIIPFLRKQVKAAKKDAVRINKYYQYFVNSVKGKSYPFTLENENLARLIPS